MELKKFISDAITQICEGVKDAQERCNKVGAKINPPMNGDSITGNISMRYRKHSKVHFNITLQSFVDDKGKSGIGVLLASMSIGTAKESSQGSSSLTSVEFSVPIALPLHVESKK